MISSFQKLNLIQFLAALNENLFKMLVAFFAIFLMGAENASEVMAKTSFLFLIPFLLFSIVGGLFADKYSKKWIVVTTRIMEFCLFLFALLAFTLNSIFGAYILLFLLATVSAIFGPTKYSLIPEFYPKERLLVANSIIAGFTFTAIILGTGAASLLVEVSHYHFYYAILAALIIAALGFAFSLTLPSIKAADPAKKLPVFIYKELFISLHEMSHLPQLLPAAIAFAYFLFIGAFVQLNIVPFSIQILGLSIISGGYLFLLAAIGIAIGALVTSKITSDLRLIPYSGFAISLCMLLLAIFPSMLWLLILGFFGGTFLVPAQNHILEVSPVETRGRNFGTANFMSYCFAILASLALYLLNTVLGLLPETSFIIIALLNAVVMIFFLSAFKKPKLAKL